jgi:acyl-CoA-binding protein
MSFLGAWQKSLLDAVPRFFHHTAELPDYARTRWEKLREREMALWILSAGAAVSTILMAHLLWYHQRKRIESKDRDSKYPSSKADDEKGIFQNIRSARSQLVSPENWKKFEEAAFRIRSISSSSFQASSSLTNGDRLLLYGLYKQVVDGNAPDTLPATRHWNILAEQAKHEAWLRMRDIPIEAAMDHYMEAVAQLCTTPDNGRHRGSSHAKKDDESDATMSMFGPAAVSRPVVENGGVEEDTNGTHASLEVQLLQAAAESNMERVRTLLANSPPLDVNYADASGQTALHLAADRGCLEIVQSLLQAGAAVNAADHDGISVLQAAVIAGHVATCQLLLQSGADPDQPDHDGDTPRACAVDDGDAKMMGLFSFEVPLH